MFLELLLIIFHKKNNARYGRRVFFTLRLLKKSKISYDRDRTMREFYETILVIDETILHL